MKIIITESQLHNLIPHSVRRRITDDDLKIIDDWLQTYISKTAAFDSFDKFCDFVLDDLIYDFVKEVKRDEIEMDPEFGRFYSTDSVRNLLNIYGKLKPFLLTKYQEKLYKAWELKRKKNWGRL